MPLTRRTTLAALPALIAVAGNKARAQGSQNPGGQNPGGQNPGSPNLGGPDPGDPKRGGTLTVVLQSEPTALVSAFTVLTWSLSVSAKVVEGLLDYDNDLNPLPQLAMKWDVAADGLSYHFSLRPGVKWHDGQDFTSADVAFSILLLKRLHPRGRSTFANVTAVETPDPLTAVFRLSKPAPYMIKALVAAETPILPKHIYEQGDPVANPANNAPIGTGPFRFKEWSRGNYALYERNAAYWGRTKALPRPAYRQVRARPGSTFGAIRNRAGRPGLSHPRGTERCGAIEGQSETALRPARAIPTHSMSPRLEFNLDNK